MSERLPWPHPVRERPRREPRAVLAIDWSGPLTADPEGIEDEHAEWLAAQLAEVERTSPVRPCPGAERLFAVMDQPGKATADASHPFQIGGRLA